MPTPAVAYLTRAFRAEAGIVISASHNPFYDNGIKFFSIEGTKLPDNVEEAIEAEMEKELTCVDSAELGKASRIVDAAGRYIEFCKGTFPNELSLNALKVVVDCAHGATYHIAPNVFRELGAQVIAMGCEPNGLNINEEVGATVWLLMPSEISLRQSIWLIKQVSLQHTILENLICMVSITIGEIMLPKVLIIINRYWLIPFGIKCNILKA